MHSFLNVGYSNNVVQCPPTDLIDSFQFLNNQWLDGPLVMDYNSLLKRSILEVYTNRQSKRIRKCALELYGRKRHVATTMADNSANIDRKITYLHVTLNDDQFPSYDIDGCYPKVSRLIILSQMTRSPTEEDKKSK